MNAFLAFKKFEEQVLPSQVLLSLFQEYSSPLDKIGDWVEKGYLIQLRRGLYIPGPNSGLILPELFTISNHLYGPSYISLESALSFWGLIPERVFGVYAISLLRSKVMETPVGRFEYRNMSDRYYYLGVNSISLTSKQRVLMANKEKAVIDKIVLTAGVQFRSKEDVIGYFDRDLRVEMEDLFEFDLNMIRSWIPKLPKQRSFEKLCDVIERL
jgi:hypothetical protein